MIIATIRKGYDDMIVGARWAADLSGPAAHLRKTSKNHSVQLWYLEEEGLIEQVRFHFCQPRNKAEV